MKCIKCDTDNNLKDRTANRGLCKNCQHPFAFEPRVMSDIKITDPLFAKAIADLSLNDTLFFTHKQFLYQLDKRVKRQYTDWVTIVIIYIFIGIISLWVTDTQLPIGLKTLKPLLIGTIFIIFNLTYALFLFGLSNDRTISSQARKSNVTALQVVGIISLVIGLSYSVTIDSEIDLALSIIFFAPIVSIGYIQSNRIANIPDSLIISDSQMRMWLDDWRNATNSIDRLLPAPNISKPSTPTNNLSSADVTDYSFDRLVVCNSNEITQMLIANNFHFENNCAILSSTGYPANIFDTVLQMLRRNPELMVYAVHDASPDGISLVYQLRTDPTWFPETTATIIDLGLLPRHVLTNSRNLFIHKDSRSTTAAAQLLPAIRQTLTAVELDWLDAGNYVELESFTPKQLIQILNRGIANSQDLGTSDSGVIWMGVESDRIYTVESFG